MIKKKSFNFVSRDRKKQNNSVSPEPTRQYSPKLISIELDQEPKTQKYPIYSKNNKGAKEKQNISPKVNYTEMYADFPRQDGKSLIVHKYALPQALIPIRALSPAPRIPNILEEKLLPRPHPIIRKGFSGWKISFKTLFHKHLKRKGYTVN